MRALQILLRHRITSWLRDPSWGTGTVAGQIVLIGILLLLLTPLGLGSYVLGDMLRELYPEANALRLINGGMLYLLPVFVVSRFLLQAPPSERVASYVALPVSRRGLLNGQALLSLLSVHTVFAIVLVIPVWGAEIATTWSPVAAGAWLGTALLLTVVLASHGAILLHLLLGRRPWGFVGALSGIALFFVADATLGPDLFRTLSHVLFGRPDVGLVVAVGVVGGTHAALLRVMQARLEVDRRTAQRVAGPSRRGSRFYQWVEQTLPAGRLAALELRQVARTRRLRGGAVMGGVAVVLFYGIGASELVLKGEIGFNGILYTAFFGIGWPSFNIGAVIYGISSGHIDGLFTRPHSFSEVVTAKLVLLWAGLLPGSLLLPTVALWIRPESAVFLLGCTLYWWGVGIPAIVYFGPRFRTPVDTSASSATMAMTGSLEGLILIPVPFGLGVGTIVAYVTGAWLLVSAVLGGAGLAGLGVIVWTLRPFVRQLDRYRHAMLAGFRENETV
jgi:hypothetical protein